MKTSMMWAAFGTLLASMYACSDDETTTTTAGPAGPGPTSSTGQQASSGQGGGTGGSAQGGNGGSQGGGGGGACLTCSEYHMDCAPGAGMGMANCEEADLCTASLALWTAYKTCVCTACAQQCEMFCTGNGDNQGCGGCVGNANCGTQEDACTADM